MDDQLGELLQGLAERDRRRGTAFLIAGDHGEGLGQHNHLEHGLVWNEQLHSPLVLVAPGLDPGRVDSPVTAPDVIPTLLGQLDLPGEEALLDQVSGEDVLAPGPEPTGVLSMSSDRQTRRGRSPTYALTGPRWKYVVDEDDRQYLYDLIEDPLERSNIARKNRALVRTLDAELRARLEAYEARAAELGAGGTAPMDPGIARQLEELGYVD